MLTCSPSISEPRIGSVSEAQMPSRNSLNDLLELLGRRWALRVLWELREEELPYRRLRTACGDISTSVLSTRLRELRDAGIVELRARRYRLTDAGRELAGLLAGLSAWARRHPPAGG
jgi:DNA-binding HxlR family transcriptional regulator